ncbi:hypothetical protein [Sorangium sp. So ce861]|uniref:hypothetical protein n=1 Tax=Sorangium sp. So ce861 TaxID=3133323 RepID=UPI003F5EB95F
MQPQTYTLQHVAPIPIGHRVELQFFEEAQFAGLFKKDQAQVNVNEPLVRDLDTGVIYASHWHFVERASMTQATLFAKVNTYPPNPLPSLKPAGRVLGRVLACRVLTECVGSQIFKVQTTLTIAPEAEAPPYR